MEVGGRAVEVVWVCTDYKFDVLRLVAVLEGKVCSLTSGAEQDEATAERRFHVLPTFEGQSHSLIDASAHSRTRVTQHSMGSASNGADSDSDYKTLITSCLSRVHVLYCNSSTELGVTLQTLRQSFLRVHSDVCALVLDNVAEFYWVDRAEAGSVRGSELKQSVWVEALRALVEEHHVVVFSALPLLFAQTTTQKGRQDKGRGKSRPDSVMCLQWRQMIKYRFLLTSSSSHCTVQRVFPPSATSHNFIVSAQGIRFS
jgi:hypothetical protein